MLMLVLVGGWWVVYKRSRSLLHVCTREGLVTSQVLQLCYIWLSTPDLCAASEKEEKGETEERPQSNHVDQTRGSCEYPVPLIYFSHLIYRYNLDGSVPINGHFQGV